MEQSRTVIEGWPALMSLEMAARYLSLSKASFKRAVTRFSAYLVDLESDLVRWRKSDLDLLVKRLAAVPAILSNNGASRLTRLYDSEVDRIANAVARRLGGALPTGQRALVSIKEAGTLLGIARTTIYRLINDGKLAIRRIGRRTLIPMSKIHTLLDGDKEPDRGLLRDRVIQKSR